MAKYPDDHQYDDGEDNEPNDGGIHHCVLLLVITLELGQHVAHMVDKG